jgi:hypothetical protein
MATIANFVHSKGLPFSAVDKPTFHEMIHEACFAPAKYSIHFTGHHLGNLICTESSKA